VAAERPGSAYVAVVSAVAPHAGFSMTSPNRTALVRDGTPLFTAPFSP
jgi:hypothetical protein